MSTVVRNEVPFPRACAREDLYPLEDNVLNKHENHNNNYNNNIRARARERAITYGTRQQLDKQGAVLRDVIGQEILDVYEEVFGRPMPRFVQREAAELLVDVEENMIIAVIEYTACAPRPSWAYARAVLIRNRDMGVLTREAFRNALYNRGRDQIDQIPW